MFTWKKYTSDLGGVHFGAWNGYLGPERVDIDIACGRRGVIAPNACILKVPPPGPLADQLLTVNMLSKILRCMVEAWEPDDGIVSSFDLDGLITAKTDIIRVGWLTYIARRFGEVPPLPEPVRVEPVGDKGSLIILTPERFTVANPDHVDLARRVREILDQAGLLRAPRG